MKIVRMLGMGLLYFCVATVLAQIVVVAMLWWKGAFSDDRVVAMFAALHGIHPQTPGSSKTAVDEKDHPREQASLDEISKKRLLASLDLSLRETTLDKSLVDLRTLQQEVATDIQRINLWKDGMDKKIAEAEGSILDARMLELQQTLMAMNPKQAKEQLLKQLETSPTGQPGAMSDVVKILLGMPLDKRKKILGEFKTPQESEKLADILREIRKSPDLDSLRDSRKELEGSKR